MPDAPVDQEADAPEEASDGSGSRTTRRRVLRLAGGAGLAGALGATGWAGRVAQLTTERDRTGLATDAGAGTRVEGSSSEAVPVDSLFDELKRFSRERSDVGLQATVLLDDGTAWHGVVGNASHDGPVPLSSDFHLYVGSVTKLYTATLVLRQVDRGTVALVDTIDEWFDLAYADDVTVEMLLNHTSGIPNYTEDSWFLARYVGRPTKRWRPDELVDVIGGDPLLFEPGSRHEYSNSNYVLLGALLERATGRRYGRHLADLVREELGYDRTYFLDYPDDTPIANGYDESILNLGRRNVTGFRTSIETGAYAAGGILSTSPEVAGVVRSLFTGRILESGTLSEMRTVVEAPDEDVPSQVGYGLGLRRLRIDGRDLVGHTGTIPGYSALGMHHDDPQYTIAVLSNVSSIDQAAICGALQGVVLEEVY